MLHGAFYQKQNRSLNLPLPDVLVPSAHNPKFSSARHPMSAVHPKRVSCGLLSTRAGKIGEQICPESWEVGD